MSDDTKTMQYERGVLIGFDGGEYSDYRFDGMLVTLRKIDLKALAQEYVTERTHDESLDEWEEANDFNGFMGWLVSKGHMAPIDYSTVFLGTYGEFDAEFNIKAEDDA